MIRIRRCPPRGLIGRRRYEVEEIDSAGTVTRRQKTTTPVTTIDEYVGVAEAWALVHAADEAWARAPEEWSSLPTVLGNR